MAYWTTQSYLQILTLLLFTNRLLAFGKDVRSQYPQYYDLYDGAEGSNSAVDIMRQRVNGRNFFKGMQTIFSLTQQFLNRLNTTCWQMDPIEKQQLDGELSSIMLEICWPFLS